MADVTLQVPVVWVEPQDPRSQWVNQIISTFQPGEFHVAFGQTSPPAIIGATEEERIQQLKSIEYVPVHTVAKVVMNREHLAQFIDVLQANLRNYDAAMEQNR